jgi:DNA-binding HxlR family transcriptional regulator
LAERLKTLQEKKIISRKVFDTNPPTTEYSLTSLGKNLKKLIISMAEFGEKI